MMSSWCCGGVLCVVMWVFFFFKQKTAYEMRISDWSSDVCSSDLRRVRRAAGPEVPIAATIDPHGNVSLGMTDNANIICTYRTTPHIDQYDTAKIGRASSWERVCQYV